MMILVERNIETLDNVKFYLFSQTNPDIHLG